MSGALALGLFWACLPRSDGPYDRQTDDDAGAPDPVDLDAGMVEDDVRDLPDAAPHAVLSVSPNHGPFTGGQTLLIRGNGFGSDARVWFGETRVPDGDVVPVDASRIQVTVPEGEPGAVAVITQNGSDDSTRSELAQAYVYDAFYLDPTSGPTSGGTEVTLHGAGTNWDEDTEVLIDLEPCEQLVRVSKTELRCTTPAGTAGAKNVRVTTSDGVEVDVLDAFIYGDAETTFRGGLSGQPLDDVLNVTVLDNITGSAIGGAAVILGGADDPEVEFANSSGIASFEGDLGPSQTVT
ncbi:MAG TPA: IPT/TIG domain-containing protein, partial [Polyangiaceae bacterium]|nr:IPT/TIG domain-containing protein [Polyangiaceae bacterium]